MILENEIASIEIKIDTTYTVDSTDNRPYDITLNPFGKKHTDFSKTMCISVNLYYEEYTIALIGNLYSYDTNCAILNNEILTVMQDNTIVQINIVNRTLVKALTFECMGCNSGIYELNDGYIIHGEIEIQKLDKEFNEVWSFWGKDIFENVSGKNSFEICDNSIKLYDFLGNYYEVDFDGNQISFIESSTPPIV